MFIYMLRNKINGKVYIGQTARESVNERFQEHIRESRSERFRGTKQPIHKAIKKYGWSNFTKHILEVCETQSDLDIKEGYWIEFYNCLGDSGYNIRHGGCGGRLNEATKQKISQRKLGTKATTETRQKQSLAKIGKKFSNEHREKMSQSHRGDKCYSAKLTWDAVRDIRAKYASGQFSQAELMRLYKVSRGCIYGIVKNITWQETSPLCN